MLAIKKQTPYNILQKVYNLLYKYKNKVSNQKNKTATKQIEEAFASFSDCVGDKAVLSVLLDKSSNRRTGCPSKAPVWQGSHIGAGCGKAKNLRRTLRTTCSRSRSRRWQRLPLASLLITKTRNSYKNMEII